MPHGERGRMMTLHTLMQFFGWMLINNLVFFAIGLLKITVFREITTSMTQWLLGELGHQMIGDVPKILMIYWIMIITFNLVPYVAVQILLSTN
jgi:hypothetical protein